MNRPPLFTGHRDNAMNQLYRKLQTICNRYSGHSNYVISLYNRKYSISALTFIHLGAACRMAIQSTLEKSCHKGNCIGTL